MWATPTIFLSTPSARRATGGVPAKAYFRVISIHALREEGDARSTPPFQRPRYFYPRPPRGGRHPVNEDGEAVIEFLSTPSARRATGGYDKEQGGQ